MANLNEEELDFETYRVLFEKCFIEVGIMKGNLGEVNPVPLTPAPAEDTDFALKMGLNEHSKTRVESAHELFSLYEEHGEREFLREKMYKQTNYWVTITESKETFLSRSLKIIKRVDEDEKRMLRILQMFNNMKIIRNLVPKSLDGKIEYDIFHPEDFPWSINYFGCIKRRDGSHRRMVMKYFGAETVDEIVVDFESITLDDLDGCLPYLKNNFEWFYSEVMKASKELTHS